MVGARRSDIHCFPLRENAALGINGCPTHNSPMGKLYYERADYSVVVKNRAPPPKAWRWEIYRAGNANPIKQSPIYFDTTAPMTPTTVEQRPRRRASISRSSHLTWCLRNRQQPIMRVKSRR